MHEKDKGTPSAAEVTAAAVPEEAPAASAGDVAVLVLPRHYNISFLWWCKLFGAIWGIFTLLVWSSTQGTFLEMLQFLGIGMCGVAVFAFLLSLRRVFTLTDEALVVRFWCKRLIIPYDMLVYTGVYEMFGFRDHIVMHRDHSEYKLGLSRRLVRFDEMRAILKAKAGIDLSAAAPKLKTLDF